MAILPVFFLLNGFSAAADESVPWTEKLNRDGIVVWTRPADGYPVDSYRARSDIEASIEDLFDHLTDFSGYPDNVQGFREMEVISDEGDSSEFYIVLDPPLGRDRDNVIRMDLHPPDADGYALIEKRALKTDRPIRKNTIRITNYYETWELVRLSDTRTRATLEVRFDPGGNPPKTVINWLLARGPYETFLQIKEQLEETAES